MGCLVGKYGYPTGVDHNPRAAVLSDFAQFRILDDEVQGLRHPIDLIIELAMRKLTNLRLPDLAPVSVPRQLDFAASDLVDVANKSCALRTMMLHRNKSQVQRAVPFS